jgi:hypothetical protein
VSEAECTIVQSHTCQHPFAPPPLGLKSRVSFLFNLHLHPPPQLLRGGAQLFPENKTINLHLYPPHMWQPQHTCTPYQIYNHFLHIDNKITFLLPFSVQIPEHFVCLGNRINFERCQKKQFSYHHLCSNFWSAPQNHLKFKLVMYKTFSNLSTYFGSHTYSICLSTKHLLWKTNWKTRKKKNKNKNV